MKVFTACLGRSLQVVPTWKPLPAARDTGHSMIPIRNPVIKDALMKLPHALFSTILLSLASCGSMGKSVTQTEATFISARPHQLVVRSDLDGTFSNQRLLPLSDSAKITVEGKSVSVNRLREGQRIRVSRDDLTLEVVAIEAFAK